MRVRTFLKESLNSENYEFTQSIPHKFGKVKLKNNIL